MLNNRTWSILVFFFAGVATFLLCFRTLQAIILGRNVNIIIPFAILTGVLVMFLGFQSLENPFNKSHRNLFWIFSSLPLLLGMFILVNSIQMIHLQRGSFPDLIKSDTQQIVTTDIIGTVIHSPQRKYSEYVDTRYLTILGERKLVFYAPSPSWIEAPVFIPPSSQLTMSIALTPDVWRIGTGDGVLFEISIGSDDLNPETIFSKYIDPKNLNQYQRWNNFRVDLSKWAGKNVTITFKTLPGPNQDDRYDWAVWGDLQVIVPIEYTYSFIDHFQDGQLLFVPGPPGEVYIKNQTISGETRQIIYAHPSTKLSYWIDLPFNSLLWFGIGMDPDVWSPDKGDGVEYNIYIRYPDNPNLLYRVFHKYIDPKNLPQDQRWFDNFLDLRSYGGQTVEIIFETLPGPNNNSNYDWGGWSTPMLIKPVPSDTIKNTDLLW